MHITTKTPRARVRKANTAPRVMKSGRLLADDAGSIATDCGGTSLVNSVFSIEVCWEEAWLRVMP